MLTIVCVLSGNIDKYMKLALYSLRHFKINIGLKMKKILTNLDELSMVLSVLVLLV